MNNEVFGLNLIQSKSNSTIVKIGKLINKKYRMNDKLFLCHGIKLFLESINFSAKIEYIVLNNNINFSDDIIEKINACKENGTTILCVTDDVFEKLTEELSPQGIITICSFYDKMHKYTNEIGTISKNEKVMMFESIRDPGNLGTIIRNAAAFGIDKIVLSSDCADIYSSKVIRATMGAIFKVNIFVVNDFCQAIKDIRTQGRKVFGAALKKDSLVLGKAKITSEDVVVIGNEGHGLTDDVLELCNDTLFIPMCENTESLNAAIATAIIMWEFSK